MVPVNLLGEKKWDDYSYRGGWWKKAIKEANRFCEINIAASSEGKNFTFAPEQSTWQLDPKSAYVHYASNETIGGVEFHWIQDTGKVPLVADASSHILSRPLDVSKFGLIYAGAQKNIGPAGLTIVIVREDLLGQAMPGTPSMLDYKVHAESGSMSNTPATYAWYIAGLVFQWLKAQGALAGIAKKNIAKAKLLYDFLDSSAFFKNPVRKSDRSRMNIPFTLADSKLDGAFLKDAEPRHIVPLTT